MNLQVHHEQIADTQHMTIYGEVDAYTAPQLRDKLLPLLEKENEYVVVHLSDVNYMDSTGLGIFVAGLKTCNYSGSHLRLEGMTPRVKRLFEVTGLMDIMDVENSAKGGAK